jgi:general secretion pathway protein D
VKHADLTDVETVLTMLVSPAGTLIADPRTSSLLVKDLKSNVDQMRAALGKLDVDIESRVFPVMNVNADTLSESVESMLTERGKLQVDPHSNVLIVTDVPTRQDQIAELIKSLDRKLDTKTWVLNYIAPEDVSERIETLVPEEMGSIVTDEDVHQITVTAVPERVQEIDALIKSWDVKRRQVQIEAFLLTMTNDVERELGINWSYFGASGSTPLELKVNDGAEPDYTSSPSDTFMIGQVPYANYQRNPFTGDVVKNVSGDAVIKGFNGSDIAAAINYLDKHGDVTLLSTPRVTVQDGEEAIFQSGSQIPYVTSSSYGSSYGSYSPYYSSYSSSSTLNSSYNNYPYNRIDFMEVGTILNVLPRITEENSILMDIAAEDSTADVTNKVISNGQENTVPLKKQSRAETQVRVDNGHTIVIGGLRTGNSSLTTSKTVPLLSDIPVLGRLFKNPSKSVKNDSLMIFITPTIVGEMTQPESEQLAKADDGIAKSLRKEDKTAFGRFAQNIKTGKNEIVVSVGQGGQIQCDGKSMSLDEFHARMDAVKDPSHSVIILRKNPRAPEAVMNSITDIALEKQIPVEHDIRVPAFVPNIKDGGVSSEKSAAPAEKSEKSTPEMKPAEQSAAPAAEAAPTENSASATPSSESPKVVDSEKPADGK